MAQGERSAAEAITAGRAVMLNRQIKDTVFSDLFGDKTRLLALYRALLPCAAP